MATLSLRKTSPRAKELVQRYHTTKERHITENAPSTPQDSMSTATQNGQKKYDVIENKKTDYTGEELEKLFIGTSGTNFDFTTYRNQMRMLAQRPDIDFVKKRHNEYVMEKHIALAAALNIPLKGGLIETNQKLSPYAKALLSKLQILNPDFDLIPTGNSPMDFDYGTDCMIHTAQTESDKRCIMRGERSYVSLGVTAKDKVVAAKQSGKNVIQSDVEVRLPSNCNEFDTKLTSPNHFELDRFLSDIAEAVQTAHNTKEEMLAEGVSQDTNTAEWIDYADYMREHVTH